MTACRYCDSTTHRRRICTPLVSLAIYVLVLSAFAAYFIRGLFA